MGSRKEIAEKMVGQCRSEGDRMELWERAISVTEESIDIGSVSSPFEEHSPFIELDRRESIFKEVRSFLEKDTGRMGSFIRFGGYFRYH